METANNTKKPMAHHPEMPPSSIPALLECACFRPRSFTDDDAGLGQLMHDYIEPRVSHNNPLPIDGLEQGDTEDCDYMVMEILHFFRENAPGAPIAREELCEIYDEDMKLVTFGTADHVAECAAVVGLDIKSGLDFKPWLHDYRGQLKAYAMAKMQQKGMREAIWAIAWVKPRKLQVFKFTYEDCEASVFAARERRRDQHAQPQTCRFCRYCARLPECPAVNPGLALVAEADTRPLLPESILFPEKIQDITEMSRALVFCDDVISAWIKRLTEIKETVSDCGLAMSEGNDIPFYQRIVKPGQKRVDNKDGAWTLLQEQMSKEAFYEALKLSLPELAKAYARYQNANGAPVTEKDARAHVEGILDSVIVREPPKPALQRIREKKGKK